MKKNIELVLIDFILPNKGSEIYFNTTLTILENKFTDNKVRAHAISVANEVKEGSFNKKSLYKDLVNKIISINPTHVGITTIGSTYVNTIIAAEKLNEALPDLKIFLGGPQASLTAEKTLDSFPFIDFIFRGEAEGSIGYLSSYIKGNSKLKNIPNIVYRKKDKLIKNEKLSLLEGEELPEVVYTKDNLNKAKSIRLEGGRGCPFNCSFCSTSNYWEKNFRMKPVNSILREIKKNKESNNIEIVHITHDLFTLNKSYLNKFCKRIKKEGVTWSCSSRADTLNDEDIKLMEESNCSGIFFGIESGDQEIQENINKNLELKKVDQLMEIFDDKNLTAVLSFIFGFPNDTPKSIYNTIKKIFKYKNYSCEIRIFTLKPFAGSPIYNNYMNDLYFDDFFYKNNLNYNLEEEDISKKELEIIKKYPDLFSAHYRIKSEIFTPYFFLAIKVISEFLLKSFPKTFYLWTKKFDGDYELFFKKIKEILDWNNKYKITKKEFLDSKNGDYIILSFIDYFESNDKYVDRKIKRTLKKELKSLL